MNLNKQAEAKPRTYTKPALVVYGSVRALTGGSVAVGNDGALPGGKNNQSDRRMKENVIKIGHHPAGFGLYFFDYKPEFVGPLCDQGRQFGVMADEVERIFPEAVSRDEAGFARVNYAMIGITRH